jgi:hypothetical protein
MDNNRCYRPNKEGRKLLSVVHNEAFKKYNRKTNKYVITLLAISVPTQKEKEKKYRRKENMQVVAVLSTKQIRKENRQGYYLACKS